MNIRKLVLSVCATIAAAVPVGVGVPTAEAAPQVWAACGIRSPENKVVATYSKAILDCGDRESGYRHIKDRHMVEWQQLAAIENRNWRDIVDMAIAKALDNPEVIVQQDRGAVCYSAQIYLVNFATGAIVKTIYPSIIVGSGRIVTAFSGGKCA
ncbi:hypothetical protein ACL02S_11840 [Nocardia sp. 004]|uniref:hypothetical protein n=1 Tax=Nocardia sp. 004 TaxID=3385978 RepID=UPI0039A13E92